MSLDISFLIYALEEKNNQIKTAAPEDKPALIAETMQLKRLISAEEQIKDFQLTN